MRHGYVGLVPRPPAAVNVAGPSSLTAADASFPRPPDSVKGGRPTTAADPMPAGTAARVIPASLRSVASGETTRPADPAAPRRLTDVRPVGGPLEHYVLGRPGGTVGRPLLVPGLRS